MMTAEESGEVRDLIDTALEYLRTGKHERAHDTLCHAANRADAAAKGEALTIETTEVELRWESWTVNTYRGDVEESRAKARAYIDGAVTTGGRQRRDYTMRERQVVTVRSEGPWVESPGLTCEDEGAMLTNTLTRTPVNGDVVEFPEAYPGERFLVVSWESGRFYSDKPTTDGSHFVAVNHDATPWRFADQ